MAILLPALGKATELARRVVCASRLKQWGIAITLHAEDNDGKLLETVGYENADGTVNNRYPGEIYLEAKTSHRQYLSHELIRDYVSGFNSKKLITQEIIALYNAGKRPDDLALKGIWKCPSNNGGTIESTMRSIKTGEEERNGRAFFRMQYAYYARVDKWRDYATHPEDITGRELTSTKLLMADVISYWGGWGGPCVYNHGETGFSWHGDESDYLQFCDYEGPPKITGTNKLFGDGSVTWKGRTKFDLPNMSLNQAADPLANPHVKGYDNDATFYGLQP